MGFWVYGRDEKSGDPDRMLSDADTPEAAREQAGRQGLVMDWAEPAVMLPGSNDAPRPNPQRTRPKVRLWIFSLVLFVGGFACRLVLEQVPGDPSFEAMHIQALTYGTGLLLLAVMWLRSAIIDQPRIFGCAGWLVLFLFAWMLIATSSHH
ncbi:MAG TPA: hypothetical protein VGJ05_01640 [Fimbriiglobus sp.]|jgi:hypothetical protein